MEGLAELLDTLVNIETLTEGKSATGGTTQSWATRLSNIPCTIRNASNDTILAYDRLGIKITNRFFFNADYTLTINDRIKVGTQYYEVRGINDVMALGRLWQVDAYELPLGVGYGS